MNRERVDKIAQAMLYEGYVLYPYRASVKNSQRWSFGCVYPQVWHEADNATDACLMRTECLVTGESPSIHVIVRFLHLLDRTVGKLPAPLRALPSGAEPECERVSSLDVGDRHFIPWQEAVEREIDLGEWDMAAERDRSLVHPFSFPAGRSIEPVRSADGDIVAVLFREQQEISGTVTVTWTRVGDGLRRIAIEIANATPLASPLCLGRSPLSLAPSPGTPGEGWGEGPSSQNAGKPSPLPSPGVPGEGTKPSCVSKATTLPLSRTRDEALMRSLISTHTMLGVSQGEFVSLTDPPDAVRAEAAACGNSGTWPVLIGLGTEHDTMLSSPIILCDYPELAPESPGNLFDSTEIDEILTLRIMTLTDEEKRTAAGTDERVRALLERTQSLARDQLMSLHGTVRGLRPTQQEAHHG